MANKPKFSNKTILLGAIVVIAIILIATVWGSYNNLVRLNEDVDRTFADTEAQYQRRFDLIPNLVSTVQGAADFEQTTLTEITQLRSQWQTAQSANEKVETANQFESALSRLLLISENYPQLQSNQNFLALQDSLAETENMISVARTRYNAAVRDYNVATKVFPSNVIAGMFGFGQRSAFSSVTGAENPVDVDFDFT